jgi:hypothetical protein
MQTYFLFSSTPSVPYEPPVYSLNFNVDQFAQRGSDRNVTAAAMVDAVAEVASMGTGSVCSGSSRKLSRNGNDNRGRFPLRGSGCVGSKCNNESRYPDLYKY